MLVQGVASDKNGARLFWFRLLCRESEKAQALAVDGGKGGTLPSAKTVEDGSYQPLSRPIFIYVNIKSADKPEVKEFVEFYMKNAADSGERS